MSWIARRPLFNNYSSKRDACSVLLTNSGQISHFSSKNFNDIDVEVDTTDREMLLIRIVTTKKTRNPATDEDKLLTR